jgi:hypothetical protein
MFGRRKGPDLVDTDELDAFFDQLDRLTQIQLLAMQAAWKSIAREEHESAWVAVRAAGASGGLAKEIDRVRDKAMAWALRGENSIPYWGDNDNHVRVKREAEEAVVDAALAVALGSRLDADAHDTLIGPWLRATEAVE